MTVLKRGPRAIPLLAALAYLVIPGDHLSMAGLVDGTEVRATAGATVDTAAPPR
jgi:hypothetical protein